MSGQSPYYVPYYLYGSGIALYVNDLGTSTDYIGRAAQAFTIGGSQMVSSIITLPNGARYDVNQTYDAPTILGPITWNITAAITESAKLLNPSYEQMASSMTGSFANQFEGGAGKRVYAIAHRLTGGTPPYIYVLTRLASFTIDYEPGNQHRIVKASVTLDPISTEWQYGYPTL